jgi:hypothetical protein
VVIAVIVLVVMTVQAGCWGGANRGWFGVRLRLLSANSNRVRVTMHVTVLLGYNNTKRPLLDQISVQEEGPARRETVSTDRSDQTRALSEISPRAIGQPLQLLRLIKHKVAIIQAWQRHPCATGVARKQTLPQKTVRL